MNKAQIETDVCQSQAIEGIRYSADSPLSRAHVEATNITWEEATAGRWPSVRALHSIMMRPSDLDLPCIGAWRTWSVYVADDVKPSAFHVPTLMDEWERWSRIIIGSVQATLEDDRIKLADMMYYHFECIHPFSDGNGRTGRLMRNALRVLLGLPWHTLTVDDHRVYVRHLVDYEDKQFRPSRKHMYPKN